MFSNSEAFEIYQYCSNQLLFVSDQAVAINIPAVEIAMDRFEAEKKSETLSKILSLSEKIIHFQREKANAERAKNKGGKK